MLLVSQLLIGLTCFWCMLVNYCFRFYTVSAVGGGGVLGLFKNVFPFVFFFLSQPLIMSDVNSVILLEIDSDV